MLGAILVQLTEGHAPLFFTVSSEDKPEGLCVSQATALQGQMGPLALNLFIFFGNYLLFATLNPWFVCVCVCLCMRDKEVVYRCRQ